MFTWKLYADLSSKPSIAIWGRETIITSVALLVWSASIAGSFWSAFGSLLFISIRSQDARLCRYYKGKHFVLPTMVKDSEVKICGPHPVCSLILYLTLRHTRVSSRRRILSVGVYLSTFLWICASYPSCLLACCKRRMRRIFGGCSIFRVSFGF